LTLTTLARGVILGSVFGLALAGTVEASNSLQSVALVGEGCPAGSVGQSFSNDRTTMTLIFDRFVASTATGLPAGESAKDCVIQLELATDEAAVVTIDSRGFVQLEPGVSATHQSHVPRAKHSLNTSSFFGPTSRDYLIRSVANVVPTGSEANPKFLIVLNLEIDTTANPTGQAQVTLDSLDLKISDPLVP
jgi:hypothetical protein